MSNALNTPLAEAVAYVRNTLATAPRVANYAGVVDVINIEAIYPPDRAVTTLVLDLSDGTTIRLDVTRYAR